MIGLVLCGGLVACTFLKTMTTDKLYQRIDYLWLYGNLHTKFNLARYPDHITCWILVQKKLDHVR